MSVIYQVFVNSSKKDVMDELNKKRLGKAHIVYGMGGEEILELSRRNRIKPWEEEKLSSISGIVNIVEEI